MNFWHMNLLDSKNMKNIHNGLTEKILRERSVIGLGNWEKGKEMIDQFRDEMKKGDIVAIKEGETPIALVKVISDSYDEEHINEELDWFPIRRTVKILDFYKPDYSFIIPSPRKTLSICRDLKKETSKNIIKWYNKIMEKNSKKNIKDLLLHKKQIIMQGPPGTGKTYTAKDIAEQIIFGSISTDKKDQKSKLEKTDQFKLIQFHPSYSYEDFVRGIIAKTNGSNIEYKTVNKVLAEFASIANKNYEDSRKDLEAISQEKWLEEKFEEFVDSIQDVIDEKEKYVISKSAYIYEVEENSFRYKGDNWSSIFRIPFSEIIKLYNLGIKERKQIKKQESVIGSAKEHATYYFNVLQKFRDYLSDKKYSKDEKLDSNKVEEKKFVLIIDEINRANLPVVLGELIYALEYRGENVNSMYDIDGDNTLIIPSNLYIIGTMNTADRSVGHIDYAIRRRFAFVDMFSDENVITFPLAKDFFNIVKLLFDNYTASDFEKNYVMLGHSYFLADNNKDLKTKLKYEVLPILNEYFNDGVLNKDESSKNALLSLAAKIDAIDE